MAGAQYALKRRRVASPASQEQAQEQPAVAPARPSTLTVGPAFDPAEAEADRIADRVLAQLRTAADGQQDHAPEHRSEHDSHGLQRSATAAPTAAVGAEGGALPSDLEARIEGKRGRGAGLEDGVRTRMESAFGTDLGDVRVHTDAEAAALSQSISAKAFTTGKDIFFGAGEYEPNTAEGEHTLAHELAHSQQQGGVRRISRKWDLKAKKLGLGAATNVRTIKSRPVWFLEDKDGDEIVVKADNQPFGLGEVVGAMHKKVSNVKSVEQRTLSSSERLDVDNMIEVYGNFQPDPSWTSRGDYMKVDPANWQNPPPKDADSRELAVDNALELLNDKKRSIIAMNVAPGEGGDRIMERNTAQSGGEFKSEIRSKLADTEHVRDLGRITTVDLFMGNHDRTMAGNVGNFFYGKDNGLTLIDQVDQGTGQAKNFQPTKFENWSETSGNDLCVPKATAKTIQVQLIEEMKKAGDKGGREWFKAQVDGKDYSREAEFEAYVVDGMREARERLLKIFATKRNIFSSDYRARKSLKKTANKASKMDEGDKTGALEDDAPDYWSILKRRAEWLRKAKIAT
jgi:hypothetical protein